jgi:hypothetical protein
MPTLRIEPVQDRATGLFFLEIFMPAEAAHPFVSTAPRYASAAAAEQDLVATISAVASRAQ